MKNYYMGALKVLTNYALAVVLFVVFYITLFKHLIIHSFLMFLVAFLLIYAEMKKLAIKEKKMKNDTPNYPLKGFVLGFFGFLPIIVLEAIYPIIVLNGIVANRIKHLVLNALLSPLYWFIKLAGNESVYSYALAPLIVILTAMLGYLAGHYGFDLHNYFKKDTGNSQPKTQK